MTCVNYNFKKMAEDPEGAKLLKAAIGQMTSGWTEDEEEHEKFTDLGFDYIKKHGTIWKIKR